MAIGGFYKIDNPMNAAMQGMANAAGTYGNMSKRGETKTEAAAKTAGGAIMSGAGGAVGGASVGASIGAGTAQGASVGGYWGAAVGAAVGLLAYLVG